MREKIKLAFPVIVEGKYDKQKVCSVAEGTVITLDGFSVFNNTEKIMLLRRICGEDKVILLTDSDSAGGFIRSKLKGYLKSENIINIYTPKTEGKEKRKKSPSKEGILGVEGIDADIIYSLLKPFAADGEIKDKGGITKGVLYSLKLLGGEGSSARRDKLCGRLGLPSGMTPKGFLAAVNIICTAEEFINEVKEI